MRRGSDRRTVRPSRSFTMAPRTIGQHAATGALPEALVASVRPWSAASHVVDIAAGHEADSHESDNGRRGPTVARRAAGRWRFDTRNERVDLSVHLQMECRRAQQTQSGRTWSSRHTPPMYPRGEHAR